MCEKSIYFLLFVVGAGLLLTGTAGAELIGWWKLDEGSGATAFDSSGYGNDGTIEGDPQWVEGKIGGALDFDGTGDYIDCGYDQIFDVTDALTVCAWVNVRSFPVAWTAAIAKGDTAWRISENNTERSMHFGFTNEAGGWQAANSATELNFGQWYHVCGVYDTIVGGRIYINGVEDGTNNYTDGISVNSADLFIGNNSQNTDRLWDGLIDDVRVYNHALTVGEIEDTMEGESVYSSKPGPVDGATDVPRDAVLTWSPGVFAQVHDVYFGTVFDDVNEATPDNPVGVLVSQNQEGTSYDFPNLLDFGQTCYWRVDEINDTEADSPWKGDVWSFTVEPSAYPIENITATASSSEANKGPENTINGSGLDENGLLHSNISVNNMWLSSSAGEQPTWIHYEFDKVYKLHQMLVWNSNDSLEPVIGFGFKDVVIEYSVDGIEYTTLGTTHEFARAPGTDGYAHNTVIDFNGLSVKSVKLTANSNWGGILNQYGLSEVRFLYIPVTAREPSPEAGATDLALDVTLGWRAGREAGEHIVYFGDNMQAVLEGSAPAVTVSAPGYGPLDLDLGTTYYWRVDEANGAEIWESDVWSFKTQDYLVVDDFEDYNDYPPDEVWSTWIDGFGITANGSTAGYPDPEFSFDEHFVETNVVHGGEQSMPLFYDNTVATYSEVIANTNNLPIGRDWTKGSAQKLVLWFNGDTSNAFTEQMYVKVNDVKAVYEGDAGNIAVRRWNLWVIDLISLGIDLNNVTSLAIGFERTGAAGGSGMVLIDDIRLYKTPPPEIDPIDPGTEGLIASYALDNDVLDSSGNGLNGTIVGDPVFANGAVGMALDFDGDGDYVDCGYDPMFDVTDALTVATWVNIRSLPQAWTAVITKGDSAWRISSNNDTTGMHFGFENGTRGWQAANSTTELNLGEWYHVCGTYDINVGAKIYINGAEDGSNPDTGGITLNAYNVAIAENSEALNRFWEGLIDEVMIYGRALSAAEVLYLADR